MAHASKYPKISKDKSQQPSTYLMLWKFQVPVMESGYCQAQYTECSPIFWLVILPLVIIRLFILLVLLSVIATLLWAGSRFNNRWYRNGLLLIVSYIFYGFVSTDALILLIFSTTINHIISEGWWGRYVNRRHWMWAGVGFNPVY